MSISAQIKKGGRYTKKEIEERRQRVFQLHFEYGYSARRISQMMNINRNTINRDVSYCYSKLRTEDQKEYDDWLNKQLYRLESQRVRLRKELDSDIILQEKLQVEKIILELDSKIINLMIKMKTSKDTLLEFGVIFLNNWLEKEGHKERYDTLNSLFSIPEKNREKIFKLLDV